MASSITVDEKRTCTRKILKGNMALSRDVFIRTDANPTIAGGHVMRCLSLADGFEASEAHVTFVLSSYDAKGIIKERGYDTIVLESDWRDIEEKADALCRLCDKASDPVVVVDTYSITASFTDHVAEHAKVCYLGTKADDLGRLSLLVNYSTDIDETFYRRNYGERGTKLLLGASNAPLRTCFAGAYREREGEVRRVLVTTGNTDPYGFVPKFLQVALDEPRLAGVSFSAVVGWMVPEDVADASERIAEVEPRVEVLRAVNDMAGLMERCDAAVTANGTTVYELSAAGLPSVTFSMVKEQVTSAVSLADLGATEYCGLLEGDVREFAEKCVDRLSVLATDPARAASLSNRAHLLVDGRGAEKVAKAIMAL